MGIIYNIAQILLIIMTILDF